MRHHLAIYKAMGKSPEETAKLSRHLFFDAADIKIAGKTGLEMKGAFEIFIKLRYIPDGGLGIYPDRPEILHYDQGGAGRRWSE